MLPFQSINLFFLSCALIISTTDAIAPVSNPLSALTGLAGGAASPLSAVTGLVSPATGVLSGVTSNLPVGGLPITGGASGSAFPAVGVPPAVPASLVVPASPIAPAVPVSAVFPPGSTNNDLATFTKLLNVYADTAGQLFQPIVKNLENQKKQDSLAIQAQQGTQQLGPIMGAVQRRDTEEDIQTKALKQLKEDIKLLSNSQYKQCIYFGICIAKDISKEIIYGAKRRESYFEYLARPLLEKFLNDYKDDEIVSSIPDTDCVLNYQKDCPLVHQIRWYNHSL